MSKQEEQFRKMPWQKVSEFASQKMIDDGEKRVRLLKLSPGFQEQDWCSRGHTGYVIDGALVMKFEEESVTYDAGDAILVSVGQPHKAHTGSESALLFLIDDV